MKTYTSAFAALAALLVSAGISGAATLNPIRPTADIAIRAAAAISSTQDYLLIGQTTTANDYMRDLFSFSLPAITVPEDKTLTITSVSLVIAFDKNNATAAETYLTLALHRLTTSFDSTATWSNAHTDGSTGAVSWTTAGGGGDYDPAVLAHTDVLANSSADTLYTWSGTDLTSVVNTAYASGDASINFLLKLANEGADNVRKVVQLKSVDSTSSPAYPQLNITYELIDKPAPAVPEPSTSTLLLAGAGLALAAVLHPHRTVTDKNRN
ncbi:MAG: DNRLRE domain-containing protein [Opitutaceae bacterium]|jgi:hypothetical protein|nr:DNRLRE domain-containing protein [Opitutaceae bacterium]